MKKKISLEELELELPKIELQETRFLLGGTGYTATTDPDFGDKWNSPLGEPTSSGDETRDPVEPVDLEPNGPEEVGDGPSGDIIKGEPDGYGETGGEGDYDPSGGGYGDPNENNQENYGDNDPESLPGDSQPPGGGGSTTGSSNQPSEPISWSDGISSDNIDWDIDLSISNDPEVKGFINQVSPILESNSIIAGLINQIRANGGDVIFSVSDLVDPSIGDLQGQTQMNSLRGGINTITLDTSNMDATGWNTTLNANGTSTPTNHSTAEESLINTIIHELNHALLNSMHTNAYNTAVSDAQAAGLTSLPFNGVYDSLVALHGQDVADIFYTKDSTGKAIANSSNQIHTEQHSHMYDAQSDYQQSLSDGLSEWNSDLTAYNEYLQNMMEWEDRQDALGPGSEEQEHP